MPWIIPNLLLHDKPVPLSNMRSHGRNTPRRRRQPVMAPIPLPDSGQLGTILDAGKYITGLPKADRQLDLTQPPREE
jgi:hypothetical protein